MSTSIRAPGSNNRPANLLFVARLPRLSFGSRRFNVRVLGFANFLQRPFSPLVIFACGYSFADATKMAGIMRICFYTFKPDGSCKGNATSWLRVACKNVPGFLCKSSHVTCMKFLPTNYDYGQKQHLCILQQPSTHINPFSAPEFVVCLQRFLRHAVSRGMLAS